MSLGVDCGTFTLVVAQRNENNDFKYKKQLNAFVSVLLDPPLTYNMMHTTGIPLLKGDKEAYACGEAAVNLAATMSNIQLRRPMKDGCLNPKEKAAQQIMSEMIYDLLDDVKRDKEVLYYSVPANAINEETNAEYHGKILEAIFKGYSHKNEHGWSVDPHPINEGLALIYAELKDKQWTGIGCSFGAGMVNTCFSIYGAPVFSFALVNSGDWIDKMTAKATGETPAYINRQKEKLDLTIENHPDLIQRAIKAQYEIMIQKTIIGIAKGLEDVGNKARTDHPIDVVIAGGTSLPKGFDGLFREAITRANLPIELGEIIRPADPLYSVARGCLIAAENHG